jgi:hypothetical protein
MKQILEDGNKTDSVMLEVAEMKLINSLEGKMKRGAVRSKKYREI